MYHMSAVFHASTPGPHGQTFCSKQNGFPRFCSQLHHQLPLLDEDEHRGDNISTHISIDITIIVKPNAPEHRVRLQFLPTEPGQTMGLGQAYLVRGSHIALRFGAHDKH